MTSILDDAEASHHKPVILHCALVYLVYLYHWFILLLDEFCYTYEIYDYEAFGILFWMSRWIFDRIFFGLFMCISSCMDVNSLKRIGVDCIVHVHSIIWATLKCIGIAWKTRRGKRAGRRSDLVTTAAWK